MRPRRIRETTDCLETDHGHNPIASLLASASVNQATHFGSLEVGRFFVNEGNEPKRFFRMLCGKPPSQRQHCGDASSIVVGARRTKYRIVVSANENDIG